MNKLPELLSPKFYPFKTKPKIIPVLKIITASVMVMLALALIIQTFLSKEANVFSNVIWVIAFSTLVYALFNSAASKFDKVKYILNKSNFIMYCIIIFIFIISQLFILTNSLKGLELVNYGSINSVLIFIEIGLAFIIGVIKVVIWYLNPKIDKKKLKKAQKEFAKYQENIFNKFK